MKVLALVPSERDVIPGQRYRVEHCKPRLRRRGHDMTRVEERYSAKVVAPRVYEVFRQAALEKAPRSVAPRRARDVSST